MGDSDIDPTLFMIVDAADYASALPILALVFCPFLWRRYFFLWIYLGCSLLLDLIGLFLGDMGANNMWVYHLIGLIELILMYLYFRNHVNEGRLWLSVFLGVMFFYVVHTAFFVSIFHINALARSVSTLFLMSLSLNYFYRIYSSSELPDLISSFDFWINAAFLTYFSASLFAFLFSYESLMINQQGFIVNNSWVIHSMANITKALILSIAVFIVCPSSQLLTRRNK